MTIWLAVVVHFSSQVSAFTSLLTAVGCSKLPSCWTQLIAKCWPRDHHLTSLDYQLIATCWPRDHHLKSLDYQLIDKWFSDSIRYSEDHMVSMGSLPSFLTSLSKHFLPSFTGQTYGAISWLFADLILPSHRQLGMKNQLLSGDGEGAAQLGRQLPPLDRTKGPVF